MLPFDGYTWNFSQHAIGLHPKNLFPLLSAASLFEGSANFGEKINEILISNNVLTSNIRNGKPDAWRDYQQILSETGLIYSTKLERNLRLTEAGRLLLQGEIGFAELMSIQAMRYQYPNGLKFAFLDQQMLSGVLIKPGTLILRLLLELVKYKGLPHISIDQCQNFLLPIVRNESWHYAFEKIINSSTTDSNLYRHARRNIQDWFKFLNSTELFKTIVIGAEVKITLTEKVLLNTQLYDKICSTSESSSSYWIPMSNNKTELITWFSHFGHLPTEYFVLLEQEINLDYLDQNYFEIPDDDDKTTEYAQRNIILSDIGENGLHIQDIDIADSLPPLINSGIVKRREKTKLHNEMINELIKHYRAKGCEVFEDKQSIDLLVKAPSSKVSIFEVKTATPRNIFQR